MSDDFKLVPRPKFAQWMFDRGLNANDLATTLGVTSEAIRRWCLPLGDENRRRPRSAVIERIVAITDSEVTEADFPEISRSPAPPAEGADCR